MKHLNITIASIAKGYVPEGWYQKEHINIQRLYYIKGGNGSMQEKDGSWMPLIPGKLYLFPHNFPQFFKSEPNDPINHIFIDFMTNPPIIADSPFIYDIDEGTPLMNAVKLLDSVAFPMKTGSMEGVPVWFGYIRNAEPGSFDEYKQLLYFIVEGLLTMLSRERELTFSNDEAVNRALVYIHENFASVISVEKLAKDNYLSTNQFILRFKKVMGITPYQYVKNYKLYQANSLIQQGNSVLDTALNIGYSHASSLSRAIHRSKESR